MKSRKSIVAACLLSCAAFAGLAQGAERATASLRIEVRVRESVTPPLPPPKQEHAGVIFSLGNQNQLRKIETEEKLKSPADITRTSKSKGAILRTTTYTIE